MYTTNQFEINEKFIVCQFPYGSYAVERISRS